MIIKSSRIFYIDLLKIYAIFMMVQGHTIDTFLHPSFRNNGNLVYSIWVFMRGYTAPVFFFVAGFLAVYLVNNSQGEKKYLRIKKGYIKAFQFLIIGHLLRFPTHKIFDFSGVTLSGWKIFFTVDALHLISISLIVTLSIVFASSKLNKRSEWILLLMSLIVLLFTPIVNNLDWQNLIGYPFSGYFYFKSGSYFPLFPYSVYIFFGGFSASILIKEHFTKYNSLLATGFLSVIFISSDFLDPLVAKTIHNLGFIILLISIASKLNIQKVNIYKTITIVSDKSLLIYIVHLVILYGCAWFPGFYKISGQNFSPQITLLFVLFMIILMYSLVIFTDRISKKYTNS